MLRLAIEELSRVGACAQDKEQGTNRRRCNVKREFDLKYGITTFEWSEKGMSKALVEHSGMLFRRQHGKNLNSVSDFASCNSGVTLQHATKDQLFRRQPCVLTGST